MGWFRLHDSTLDNPKVQRLKPELFRAWVNILCVANRHGGELPAFADLAFELRVPEPKARALVKALIEARLVDEGETLRPHDWDEHQYVSDNPSTKRVRRFRERQRSVSCNADETPGNAVSETQHLSEQTTETEQTRAESAQASPAAPPAAKRGRRLDIEKLPDDWRAFCVAERSDLDAERTWARFRDHFIAAAGQKGVKLDWFATWRNWVRNERAPTKSLFDPKPPPSLEEVDKWGRA